MSEIDIFVSSTSTHHFGPQEVVKKQRARWDTGHFDEEIDFAGSEDFGDNIKPQLFFSSCSFTDQMLAQLAVLRNLFVNEVYHLGQNNYSFDALQAYCFGINIKL